MVKVRMWYLVYFIILFFEYRNITKKQVRKEILKYIGTDV